MSSGRGWPGRWLAGEADVRHAEAVIGGLDHVQLAMPEGGEARARAFYGEVLALAEVPKPARLAARGGIWFALPDGRQLHVGREETFAPARKAHPALRAADARAVAERLESAGHPVRWDHDIPGVRRFHVADPFGNRVEVVEEAPSPVLAPIGHVRGGRREPVDDGWGGEVAVIELAPRFGPEALAGLGEFSHVEVIFQFHLVAPEEVETGARRPRGRADWPEVGIFAQRGRSRPNRLGVSVCRLLAVEGARLRVQGLDAIDGTPVLDLKPVMRGFLPREPVSEPPWAAELMQRYFR